MIMKKRWVYIVRGVAYMLLAVVFFGIKLYDISMEIGANTFAGIESTEVLFWEQFRMCFTDVFQVTSMNYLIGVMFLILGGTEFIGVKKNGN